VTRRIWQWPVAALALALGCASTPPAEPAPDAELVVLLHGLSRTERSMAPMAAYLEENGFRTENIGYASTEVPIGELTERLHEELQQCCLDADRRLNFVTHSLGGILVRAYVAQHSPANMGRVVMLSPPNKGSELADGVRDTWLADVNPVAAVNELGTDPGSIPNLLGPATFEVGVITGNWSWHPMGAIFIECESDGVVSVESARVEGMKAFLVVPSDHTFIMRDPEVAKQVVHFLRTGEFLGDGHPVE
jgi:triacylglycerol lipase